MNEQQYIEFLINFRFTDEHMDQLVAIPVRATPEQREALREAIESIENTIRTYRFDLRSYKLFRPSILKELKEGIAETEPVRARIENLVKEHRYLGAIRYNDGWLMKLSSDLEIYAGLLQATHDFVDLSHRGSRGKAGGRPVNQRLFMVAIDVGRNLKLNGFKLVKSRNSLFYKLFVDILEILQADKSDPYNFIEYACDYLKDFEPSSN